LISPSEASRFSHGHHEYKLIRATTVWSIADLERKVVCSSCRSKKIWRGRLRCSRRKYFYFGAM